MTDGAVKYTLGSDIDELMAAACGTAATAADCCSGGVCCWLSHTNGDGESSSAAGNCRGPVDRVSAVPALLIMSADFAEAAAVRLD